VLKLKEGVTLQRAVPCRDSQDLVVASSTGRLLRLAVNEANLPVMGRNAQGPVLLRLLPGEAVVGAVGLHEDGSVVMASREGLIHRLPLDNLRRCQRGGIGQVGARFEQRDDQLVDLCNGSQPLLGVLLADGRSLRLDAAEPQAKDETCSDQELSIDGGGNATVTELVPLLS
jgi:DNA gyrase subunit A